MRKFLKKSSVILVVLTVLVSVSIFVFANEANDDTKQNIETITSSEVADKAIRNDVLKKSKTTKKNYSNTIRVLVTPKQKQAVRSKVKQMDDEIEMLAKVIYREARGESKTYQSAVAWTVLNRVDAKGYGSTIERVITSPNQYCWIPKTPVHEKHKDMAEDVVTRWLLEKEGHEEVGRTIPKTYKFFSGDGVNNYFREDFDSTTYWSWELKSPY